MRGRTQGLDADGLPFQISDGADAVVGEQFEAADHRAGQHRYPLAGIDRLHALRGIERPKVALAARELPEVFEIRPIDIADISKALGAQQLLGDVQRGYAEGRLQNADGRRFERFLGGHRSHRRDETGGTSQRQHFQKTSPRLRQCHWRPPLTPSARV